MMDLIGSSLPPSGQGWMAIGGAPRDGTVVELCNCYGIKPWYGLYRWKRNEIYPGHFTSPQWRMVGEEQRMVEDAPWLYWRPYDGTIEGYVDPTRGKQGTDEYWRLG